MYRLPEADDIIALGSDGKVLEQGSFVQLRSAGGYIQGLDVNQSNGTNQQNPVQPPPEGSELVKAVTAPVEEADIAGQTTDSTVWKYYAKSLGWSRLGLWGIFLTSYIVIHVLRCASNRYCLAFISNSC